ncbi:phosphate acetyltransferase [Spiroplasma eriocheiris]|uniref:Phosphate acetyltransferase n=1 Tax=Spiroplasma eriocheiris TaxID=315358 RepID=A0A0H3XKS4_9MOLU|nr:phosphate acetyltransferase [Spiroplasma eriocheiris]AHF58102.1 putative phosphate acetyltransferase [Spiroplasma eriocheiris CCTCC M 207170]AKM54541.1 phosphotransacetylase [Spiroplasma eriocheiris]
MNVLELIMQNIEKYEKNVRIIFPEGASERIQEVVPKFQNTKITPVLVFQRRDEVPQNLMNKGAEILVIEEQNTDELANFLVEIRKGKTSIAEATRLVKQRNYFATIWVKMGKADGMVGGISYDTKDIIRPALQIIRPKANVSLVSSFFLMVRNAERYIFTDCALNINPSAEELADIAHLGYEASQIFDFKDPKMALLSYSTKGSGAGDSVDKVLTAYEIIRSRNIDCLVDGEFQFDAAWDDEIRKKKAPTSPIKSRTDIFVFPNLDAGNIGYKIAQRMGSFKAVGPIIIGLDKPVNDLSRGATADDIYNTVLVTAYSYVCSQK